MLEKIVPKTRGRVELDSKEVGGDMDRTDMAISLSSYTGLSVGTFSSLPYVELLKLYLKIKAVFARP